VVGPLAGAALAEMVSFRVAAIELMLLFRSATMRLSPLARSVAMALTLVGRIAAAASSLTWLLVLIHRTCCTTLFLVDQYEYSEHAGPKTMLFVAAAAPERGQCRSWSPE
jgi:hypothetical protein